MFFTPELFKRYLKRFSERLNILPLLEIREDSIRYDLFATIMEVYGIPTWHMHLERSMHPNSYAPRVDPRRKRKENRLLDLVVEDGAHNCCFEFGLFRQSSNPDGTIDRTAKTGKLINDLVRLTLEGHLAQRESYLIGVADDKMIGHQLQTKLLDAFPANYAIDAALLGRLCEGKTFNEQIDAGLKARFEQNGSSFDAFILFNEPLHGAHVVHETRLIVWSVTPSRN